MSGTKNAVITHTMLGYEDHGILTAYLYLDYGGSCQGFGGYALDRYVEGSRQSGRSERIGTAYGCEFIIRILSVLGVDKWEKIPGTHCRVKASHEKAEAIGHILKDKWFDPQELKP